MSAAILVQDVLQKLWAAIGAGVTAWIVTHNWRHAFAVGLVTFTSLMLVRHVSRTVGRGFSRGVVEQQLIHMAQGGSNQYAKLAATALAENGMEPPSSDGPAGSHPGYL